jgi:hypothetical protein
MEDGGDVLKPPDVIELEDLHDRIGVDPASTFSHEVRSSIVSIFRKQGR